MTRPAPSPPAPSVLTVQPRRRAPWLVVEVDGSPHSHEALVWALREAARREATVVAVTVPAGTAPDGDDDDEGQHAARERLAAALRRAIDETGVRGRASSAVLERPVFDALTAAVRGADLVVVGAAGRRLLRPAVPRVPLRRTARGA